MTNNDRREMKASNIPAFVVDVIEAGSDICAVGPESYVIGDLDGQDAAIEELKRIGERYGDRAPLKLEIIAYLWSIGRYIELGPKARGSRTQERASQPICRSGAERTSKAPQERS